ncbi:glutamate receptor ionotropic, kainate 1-like, partial [Limulus polyphemus]|uniref:Glutamate receptor ionotropic, kainate 1-like n=1 Tax=Limulus polyphemus TaxID=6850 RepID=A0ABM1BXX7_LIMPO
CSLMKLGVAGIFGTQSDVTSMHVQSICDALDIPHVEARWDFQLQRQRLPINLFPRPAMLGKAYVDLVRIWGWTEFCLVYEESEGVIRLQDFFKEAQKYGWRLHLYQFKSGEAYRDLFWKIKVAGDNRIVLDVKRENIYTVLKHAQQVGMMTENHSYLITSLDVHTVDLEDFKYGKSNITAFRIVDMGSPELQSLFDEWSQFSVFGRKTQTHQRTIKTQTALIYDAVKLFAKALADFDTSKTVVFPPIFCESGEPSEDAIGTSIRNLMKLIKIQGLTGEVKFDQQGYRSEFHLDLLFLSQDGFKKIGGWHSSYGINITLNATSEYNSLLLQNKSLIVTTVINPPYTMLKDSAQLLSGNDRYEGYCVDLIFELSRQLGFKYRFKLVEDNAYGIKNDKGEWNGMIGELIRG